MRIAAFGAVGATLLVLLGLAPRVLAQENNFLENKWVAILSVYKTFEDAKADAQKIAKAGGVPFTMDGRIFDKKRGLIYPDNDDEAFPGQYIARRYNETEIKNRLTEYISIERSDGYEGFKPGYYIVVAGVYDSAKAADAQIKRLSSWAPTAYAKKTKIYMGCLH